MTAVGRNRKHLLVNDLPPYRSTVDPSPLCGELVMEILSKDEALAYAQYAGLSLDHFARARFAREMAVS